MKNVDIDILEHIRNYCSDIQNTVERFGNDKTIFESDRDFRNSICMSLLQIGELTGHLSDEFKEKTREQIYWPAIKGMRNIFAHNYGAVDIDRVWDTISNDITQLASFCNETASVYRKNSAYKVIDP
ncbi:MAG: DUF86 domain-containing protein [Lachnospiraceae bacterium]|nr:DUF86 domain-containing protein [Lachnospiraceae bacterium]